MKEKKHRSRPTSGESSFHIYIIMKYCFRTIQIDLDLVEIDIFVVI